jgi:hypothetical protein
MYMHLKRASATLTLLALLFSTALRCSGQGSTAGEVDNPDLYMSLFRYQQYLVQELARSSSSTANQEKSIAIHFNLTVADFRRASTAYLTIASALKDLDAEVGKYVEVYGRSASPVTLAQFEKRRKDVMIGGLDRLKQQISPAGWAALVTYVNANIGPNTTGRRTHQ